MNFYSVLPIHILRNKNLSAVDKLLYMEITSRVTVAGIMKFNLHGLAMAQGITHYTAKVSLNNLAREKLIWRIAGNISLFAPDSEEFVQLEIDTNFVDELIREWNSEFKRDLPKGVIKTASLTGAISDCLLSFSKDDLYASIGKWHDYCFQDKWWGSVENKTHRANMFKFFSNDDRVSSALNYAGRNSNIVIQKDESENKSLLN
jgi:hypothetical protein